MASRCPPSVMPAPTWEPCEWEEKVSGRAIRSLANGLRTKMTDGEFILIRRLAVGAIQ